MIRIFQKNKIMKQGGSHHGPWPFFPVMLVIFDRREPWKRKYIDGIGIIGAGVAYWACMFTCRQGQPRRPSPKVVWNNNYRQLVDAVLSKKERPKEKNAAFVLVARAQR